MTLARNHASHSKGNILEVSFSEVQNAQGLHLSAVVMDESTL
jgi:hypothetical protein